MAEFHPFWPRAWITSSHSSVYEALTKPHQLTVLEDAAIKLAQANSTLSGEVRETARQIRKGSLPQAPDDLLAKLASQPQLLESIYEDLGIVTTAATPHGVRIFEPPSTPRVERNRCDPETYALLGYEAESIGMKKLYAENKNNWEKHFTHCRSMMEQAAQGTPQRDLVVVVGAGRCADVPLAELARLFKRVELVDTDCQRIIRLTPGDATANESRQSGFPKDEKQNGRRHGKTDQVSPAFVSF